MGGVTSAASVPLEPAGELLTFGGGDVGVVRAVDDGRDHALMDRRKPSDTFLSTEKL